MFQHYSNTVDFTKTAGNIQKLRELMRQEGIDGFIVSRADEHQGEYVAACDERLAWLTGFNGSAGFAIICLDKAVLFVDGRYTLQVRQQTDNNIFEYASLGTNPISWLQEQDIIGKIGYDPKLHSYKEIKLLKEYLGDNKDLSLVSVEHNLVDSIWADRPKAPQGLVELHDINYAGQSFADKLQQTQATLEKEAVDFTLLSDTSSVAWLLNIRGHDIAHNPVILAHAIVQKTGAVYLFVDATKVPAEVRAALGEQCIIKPKNELVKMLRELGEAGQTAIFDPKFVSDDHYVTFSKAGGKVVTKPDPTILPRAIKNATELRGTRKAHLYDAVAMIKFLSWLDTQEIGTVTEISASKQLELFRKNNAELFQSKLEDISFDSISGTGANGAVIHYRVNEDTNQTLQDGDLYLIDSGGQYKEGTTDITRTVPVGTIKDEYKFFFTLVLKGMINLSIARFPVGTRGADLDSLARISLWKHGYDYAHGTGHGVGSYLAVHEGPQNISKVGLQPLHAGMIVSNEPGYYRAGAFGIRIENLVVVREEPRSANAEISTLGFETLTLVPIDRRLIDKELLTNEELLWLNDYHKLVYNSTYQYLNESEKHWLERMTATI